MPDPVLTTWRADGESRGVALLLHGGRDTDLRPVMRRHASWWRMALLGRALADGVRERGVSVELLRYRTRGWNEGPGTQPGPVLDGRWALRSLRERYGEVPVVLVGHSMGGRAVCRLAGADGVTGVVALAAWLGDGDPVRQTAGQRLVLAHGTMDRWTSPRGSLAWAGRARAARAHVARYELPMVGHFMFSRARQWNGLVRDSTLGMLGLAPLPAAAAAAQAETDGADGLRLAPVW